MATRTDITVYSKPGCCLCDDVKEQLRRLQQRVPFEWREVNILEDPEAFAKFQYEVPVVFVGGRKVAKFYFDEKRFLDSLQRAAGPESMLTT